MRKDIAKVLVTRPRFQGSLAKRGRPARDIDDLPRKESMRRKHIVGYSGKQLNEYLSPLEGFINRSVGKKWDKVYSEIREQIKPGNTIHEHILEHVDDYIAINVVADETSPTGMASHRKFGTRKGSRYAVRPGEIYVDPKDGIIKKAKGSKPPKRRYAPEKNYFVKNDVIYFKTDGIWYSSALVSYETVTIVHNAEVPILRRERLAFSINGQIHDTLPDVAQAHLSSNTWAWTTPKLGGRVRTYGENKTTVNRHQLSSKELRQFNLTND